MFPVPTRELARLNALQDLDVLGSPSEARFDALCETAQALFGMPIALVSLVGENEQWFKARCGLDVENTPREHSFCTYAILSDTVLVIDDATQDPRFADNPLVTGEPHVRFYAGAPLILSSGIHLGSLCVIDRIPRTFSPVQCRQLQSLAAIAVAQLRLHRTERQLREREERYRLIAESTTDMIVRSDLDGTRRYVSPACRALLGYTPEELIGTRPLDFVHPEDAPAYRSTLRDLEQARLSQAISQQRYRHKDGTWIWVEATFNLTHDGVLNKPDGYVASVRDITLRKQAEHRMVHLAQHDPLTGLPNRRLLRERLEEEIARTKRHAGGFALLCLDLDHFKRINDTLGHQAGDSLLRTVAERLRSVVRAEDTVARLGGDEFVIIQTGNGRWEDAATLAERLIEAMSAPIDLNGYPAGIGISIGVALACGRELDPETLYKQADLALYQAKAAGRNTYRVGPDPGGRRCEARTVAGIDLAALITPPRTLDPLRFEEMLGSLLTSSTDCVKLLDRDGGLLFCNPAGLREMESAGITPNIGQSWVKIWQSESRAAARRALVQARGRQTAHFQGMSETASGEPRWWDVVLSPVAGSRSAADRILCVARDVTATHELKNELRLTAQRYRTLVEASVTMVWHAAPDGAVTEGFGWETFTGQPTGASTGDGWLEVVHPEERERIAAIWSAVVASEQPGSAEYRVRRADGIYRWIGITAVPLKDASGRVQEWFGTATDIHDRRQAEEALREREERYRLAALATRDAIWDWDLTTDRVTWGEAARTQLGYDEAKIKPSGAWWLSKLHPEDRNRVRSSIDSVIHSSQQRWNEQYRFERNDGSYAEVLDRGFVIRDEQGLARRMVGAVHDVTDRKRAEEKLWRAANHDPLTGLPNRRLFQDRLGQAPVSAGKAPAEVSLLLVGLDDFKDVNDTLGHMVGDAVLRETALRLGKGLREGDTLARLGSDEFALLLWRPLTLEQAKQIAEELLKGLRQPFHHRDRLLGTKASIGIATGHLHDRDPQELLKDADLALDRAKRLGRNCAVIFSSDLREETEQRVSLAREVREALAAGQIVPFYQPKVCFKTGRIVGFEALARWQHPSRGVLTPSYFGAAFEDSELAAGIGDAIIRQVSADIRTWIDNGLGIGRVAVNLSTAEFRKPELAEVILAVLREAGVPPEHFEVEVTETVFLGRGSEAVPGILGRLHESGVTIALDDFGTGFASLTHLKQFPVDHIKIDRSFVRNLTLDKNDTAIVAAVIGLGRSLDMQVTAEGVETEDQVRQLQAMGCDHAQGYRYAKPMAASRVPKLLRTWVQPYASGDSLGSYAREPWPDRCGSSQAGRP